MRKELWMCLGASAWVGFIVFSFMMAQLAGLWASLFLASFVSFAFMFWLFGLVIDAEDREEAERKKHAQ